MGDAVNANSAEYRLADAIDHSFLRTQGKKQAIIGYDNADLKNPTWIQGKYGGFYIFDLKKGKYPKIIIKEK